MKIKPYYANHEVAKKINADFGLSYLGQDWEIVNADADKVQAFIDYYLLTEDIQEKVTMFALLIASLDEIEDEDEIQKSLRQIEKKVYHNLKIHLNTIVYWALIGHGKKEEHVFPMTKYMRLFLREKLPTDKIKIKSTNFVGIEINGIDFLKVMGVENIDYEIRKFIDFLNIETGPGNEQLELSEEVLMSCEKEKEFTHFEFWSPSCKSQYFKIRTKGFEEEMKKNEL